MEPLWMFVRNHQIDTVIFSGREARIVGKQLNLELDSQSIAEVKPETFYKYYEESGRLSTSIADAEEPHQ